MDELPSLAHSEKRLSRIPSWSEPEADTAYCWFDVPLEIAGIVERGFELRGGCYSNRPDCHVTFEIRATATGGRTRIPLMRVDWRSLNGGHKNPVRKNSPWSGRRVPDTHLHDFDLNWLPDTGRMRAGNLRIARPIEEPLETFEELRKYVGKCFNISNIDIVPVPPWVYDLLSGG